MKKPKSPMKSILADDHPPARYVPVSLREPTPEQRELVTYACGYRTYPCSMGMFAGPFPTLAEALDVVPEEKLEAWIIRFNKDGTEDFLYRWWKPEWVRQ